MPETPEAAEMDAKELAAKLEEATAEAEKWKSLSRKNEDRAKENAEAAKRAADLEKQLADIAAQKDATATDAEKALQRIADLEATIAAEQGARKAAELTALRAKVGSEAGLPPALIARLSGEDEDAIKADAESLKAAIPAPQTGPQWPDLGQGKGAADADAAALEAFRVGAGIKPD